MGDPNTGILYSSDGSNWIEPASSPLQGIKGSIGWNGSRLVAAGPSSDMVYSDDYGITWTRCIGDTNDFALSVQWNGSYWLATGSPGITRSVDGITWTNTGYTGARNLSLAYTSNAIPSLAIGQSTLQYVSTSGVTIPGLTVAVGVPSGTDTTFYSEDGLNWSPAVSGALDTTGLCVGFGNETWVTGGGDSTKSNIVYSSDGSNWTQANVGIFVSYPSINAVLYGGTTWVAALEGQLEFNSVMYSTDNARNWNTITTPYTTPGKAYAIGYGPTGYFSSDVFLVAGVPANMLFTSPDGQTWSQQFPSGFFDSAGTVRGFLYAASKWWVVGGDGGMTTTIKNSIDATTWADVTFDVADCTLAYGIAYDGVGLFVAVGTSGGGGGTIKYSSGGCLWMDSVTGEFDDTGRSVIYNSELSLWIATGTDDGTSSAGIRYSGDGSNWSNSSGNDLILGAGVAATVAYSIPGEIQQLYNQVSFLNNPLPSIAARNISPSLAYGPSSFILNNTLVLDPYQNVAVNTLNINLMNYMSNTFSTFYNFDFTNVTQTVSTNNLSLLGAFTLGTQYI